MSFIARAPEAARPQHQCLPHGLVSDNQILPWDHLCMGAAPFVHIQVQTVRYRGHKAQIPLIPRIAREIDIFMVC
jgi:hypothetical protein